MPFPFIMLLALLMGCAGREIMVEKVIDGDTVELGNGTRIRLAGINTPERDEPCYWQARGALETLAGGKKAGVRALGKDKYGRTLGEVYIGGENINIKMLEFGLANRYYSEGVDWAQYSRAEQKGRSAGGCMWERDEVYACIAVKRSNAGFEVRNGCNVTIDTPVIIRDTSASHRFKRHLYLGPYESVSITEGCNEKNGTIALCQNIFNYNGDEVFIINEKSGKLVGWAAYGIYGG
ncbi:MAG: thermonuclease family protein [Candidatus Micrarchaeia archaeon]